MCCIVNFLQLTNAVMRVVLRSLQRCVTHKLLNMSHIRPTIEQMCRKSVPQNVGALLALNIRPTHSLGNDTLNLYARQRVATI